MLTPASTTGMLLWLIAFAAAGLELIFQICGIGVID